MLKAVVPLYFFWNCD